MAPYITLNGISSLDKGLRLLEASPFILPARTRQRETIPGRIGSISSAAFEMPAKGIRLSFSREGEGKADIINDLHNVASWALQGNVLTLWYSPAHYYTGSIEGNIDFSMLTKKHGRLDMEFIADPPCRHRALVSGGFIPSPELPIPEQISDVIKTAVTGNQNTAFDLDAGEVRGSLPPALYLKVTGSWTDLSIGSLAITESTENISLYIDSVAQEAYKIVSGVRTNVKHSGGFPALVSNKLSISGTSFSLSTARLLVIERG